MRRIPFISFLIVHQHPHSCTGSFSCYSAKATANRNRNCNSTQTASYRVTVPQESRLLRVSSSPPKPFGWEAEAGLSSSRRCHYRGPTKCDKFVQSLTLFGASFMTSNSEKTHNAREDHFGSVKDSCFLVRWLRIHCFINIFRTICHPLTCLDFFNTTDDLKPEGNYQRFC